MSDQERIHMSCDVEIDHLLREVDHAEEVRDHARFMASGWRRLAKRLLRIPPRVHCGVQSAEDREERDE